MMKDNFGSVFKFINDVYKVQILQKYRFVIIFYRSIYNVIDS